VLDFLLQCCSLASGQHILTFWIDISTAVQQTLLSLARVELVTAQLLSTPIWFLHNKVQKTSLPHSRAYSKGQSKKQNRKKSRESHPPLPSVPKSSENMS
jgi:hypothetical protein